MRLNTEQIWTQKEHSTEELASLLGELDSNVKLFQEFLGVRMRLKDGHILLKGEAAEVEAARSVLDSMYAVVQRQGFITRPEVCYLLEIQQQSDVPVQQMLEGVILSTAQGKPIRAKTLGQKQYVDAIKNNGFTFGIGPAGTGKTYLAVAMAIKAFKSNEVNRIILTRPAVEAGESLGFLPGDLQEKIDPYLRPLYDALYEMLGPDNYIKYKERGQIEVAPLAYMRGRTLDHSFIILDEAQNTTTAQMKMFLTRMGYGSKAVITGDVTQVDLPSGKTSGLKTIQHILKDVKGVEFCEFQKADVVRHPLVQRVIEAFERYEKNTSEKKK
ncbi:MAG: PhoH family protein [Peptoniphilaceae bacterium]|nr:PhoH family protein [Peptoniphilaceae bacterium]MDD7434354.1 PhoH family protein [Peptoniphilaceae bacterium]MDY3076345.1 PhoH family protein [Peptoniphilaceae bacterium]MDY4195750.1 PhoH family protein [Peptoniphilaceae bacterium]